LEHGKSDDSSVAPTVAPVMLGVAIHPRHVQNNEGHGRLRVQEFPDEAQWRALEPLTAAP
jgi:hypothetical protein